MSRYTEQQKLRVVEEYLSGSAGLLRVARLHGVDVSALRSWVAAYRLHGKAGLKKKPSGRGSAYSPEFKLSVLEKMRCEGMSYRQVAALFDIRRFDIIGAWERQYEDGGIDALIPKSKGGGRRMSVSPKPEQAALIPESDARTRSELLEELNALRMENAYLKKLNALVQANKAAAQRKGRK